MPVFYNAKTRPDIAVTTLKGEEPVDPSSTTYELNIKRASASREEAISRDVSGTVFWMQDGQLYTAYSVGSFEYRPLTQEPTFNTGLNWSDAFFFTEQAAEEWAERCGCRHDPVKYYEEGDVYGVHFHHLDNPDCLRQGGTRKIVVSGTLRRMELK